MRRLGIALIATIGIAFATPTLAQGIYLGAGPGGIGIGVSPGYGGYHHGGYHHGGYHHGGYHDGYAPAYGYRSGGYRSYDDSYAYSPGYRRCRTVMIETPNGNLRRVRRCS